jgi:uncharacterized SAM-binding protein YcdF (DUF218 family)
MHWVLTNIVSTFLLPPADLLLLMVSGLLLLKSNGRWGTAIITAATVAFWLLSTPLASKALLQALERDVTPASFNVGMQAIVVLGAGSYTRAPEYGGVNTVSDVSLERVRYAAYLANRTGLPVLASGGNPGKASFSEGEIMKSVLESEFNTPVRWVENHSDTSADEARECWKILAPQHISRIYLVTHAWHMPRARAAFEKVGFKVVAAPTGFATASPINVLQLIPDSRALNLSRIALHEWIGLLWYRLTGKT